MFALMYGLRFSLEVLPGSRSNAVAAEAQTSQALQCQMIWADVMYACSRL